MGEVAALHASIQATMGATLSGPIIIPKYALEWLRFIRSPAAYVERARLPEQREVYEPWAAFCLGLFVTIAFAVYDAQRSHDLLHKETELVYLFLAAVVNFLIVHTVCLKMDGKATLPDMAVAFEYLYGFLVPAMAATTTLMMAFSALFPGVVCRTIASTFDCRFPPTTTSVFVVSVVQTVFLAESIYVLAVFNLTITRLHRLSKWRVLLAQAMGLGVLFLTTNFIYAFAHWIATRFDAFLGLAAE
jgi:hypothetical protein